MSKDLGTSQEKAALVNVGDKAYGQHVHDKIPKDANSGNEAASQDSFLPMPKIQTPAAGCNKG